MEFTPQGKEAKMASKSTTIQGIKVRTSSTRRYVLYMLRPWDLTVECRNLDGKHETYVKFAQIERRSDSWQTIAQTARRLAQNAHGPGVLFRIWDTATGEVLTYDGRDGSAAVTKPEAVMLHGLLERVVDLVAPDVELEQANIALRNEPTDPVSAAVLALEAAGWTVKDADRDSVWMTGPTGGDIELQASDD
jgi:hypothetical protein